MSLAQDSRRFFPFLGSGLGLERFFEEFPLEFVLNDFQKRDVGRAQAGGVRDHRAGGGPA